MAGCRHESVHKYKYDPGCICSRIAHMALDTSVVGARIADARERAGLTQAELSSETGIERSALAKIERGIRGVRALELAAIARAVDFRLEWFLSEPPAALVSYRLRADADLDIATIDRVLERLARDVESVQSLAPSLVPAPLEPAPPLKNQTEADELAVRARALCGIDNRSPINDLVKTVGHIGLLAFSKELGADTADAGTILLTHGAVALVNSTNHVGRRRLALAHELGHYLLADDYAIDWRVADQTSSDVVESRIDRFARAFLAPAVGLGAFWTNARQTHTVRDAAVLAASHFRIDMSTLARRLRELELADGAECGEVRNTKTSKSDFIEFGLFDPHEMEGTSVPPNFGQVVIKLFKQKRLSAERALSLLQGTLEYEDLPLVEPAHESEIWDLLL